MRNAPLVRWITGMAFIVAGSFKFTAHAGELSAFERYGLPAPDAFVYMIGTIEILGGALLLAGLATRLAALVLAGTMAGAIVVSGIGEGEVVPSLTFAPLLLAAMLFLLWVGPDPRSLDARLFRGRRALH